MSGPLDSYAERAFAEAECQAERTAGWLRLIVGLSLGGLLVPLALNPELLPNFEIAGGCASQWRQSPPSWCSPS